ncbi:hypothetical protein HY745_09370, partial [Candidatus Desantisbacteria bacterium]|nr:hypothetical protein [Candidatus Desantisbacteria bacterium]
MHPQKMADLNLLLDFYGDLLTEHQYNILFLWCNHDLSFGEISMITSLSRQAVYDILKQGQKKLYDFEEKLHLLKDRKSIKKDFNNLDKNDELKKYLDRAIKDIQLNAFCGIQ